MTLLHPVLVSIPPNDPPRTPQQVQCQRDCARGALERCAELCDAPQHGWTQDPSGVPLPNAGFHWSITHTRRWAAAVIANEVVGIDIESVTPRQRLLHDHVAGDDEWGIIGDRSWASFFRMWTAKEACLKACGLGIAHLLLARLTTLIDSKRMLIEFQGRSWTIEHFFHDGHVAAVTVSGEAVEWHVVTLPA